MQDYEERKLHIKSEKNKAKELRKSTWWHNLCVNASCYYCQTKLSPETATMDHIIPLSQGGTSRPGNVVPSCKPCNTEKKDRSAVEWLLSRGTL
ncbi:MAG: HNH endonuclease [Deltaproteobacteria bacterium]|nr:HNH endonuclease [Deltaproteobacteria bacterium]